MSVSDETLELSFKNTNFDDIYSGFVLKKKNWNDFHLRFEFEASGYNDLIYGIVFEKGTSRKSELKEKVKIALSEDGYKGNENWLLFKGMQSYRNWDDALFEKLVNSDEIQSFKMFFEEKVKELLDIVQE